ncbi:hypothetical protein STEG23_019709, partial [Scotinomys teguina]
KSEGGGNCAFVNPVYGNFINPEKTEIRKNYLEAFNIISKYCGYNCSYGKVSEESLQSGGKYVTMIQQTEKKPWTLDREKVTNRDAVRYSNVYMYHIFLIHSSVEGHLDCFQVLAITNNAAMNIVEHVSLLYDWAFFGLLISALNLVISLCLFLMGNFASSCSRAFSFDLVDLSIGESGVLKSPTINVWGLMYDFSFSNVSFTYVVALCVWGINVQN